jgi:hypothetical protein
MADCAATYAGRADGTEDSAPDHIAASLLFILSGWN